MRLKRYEEAKHYDARCNVSFDGQGDYYDGRPMPMSFQCHRPAGHDGPHSWCRAANDTTGDYRGEFQEYWEVEDEEDGA